MTNDKNTSIERVERVSYYDVLRILAMFSVVVLHVAANKWNTTDVTSFTWNCFNFYDSIVRWSVPVFVMISGALFLNSTHTIKRIFKKNILRIVTAFIFWSVVYAILFGDGKSDMFFRALKGHYHMWFLFMIVGLYLIVPFVREIVKSQKLTKYFLVLSCLFAVIIPHVLKILLMVDIAFVQDISKALNSMLGNMYFHMGVGFVFYYVAGYYLSSVEIQKKARLAIYLLGIVGFAMTIVLSARLSILNGKASNFWYGYHTINVMLESIAVFVFAKYNLSLPRMKDGCRKFVSNLAKYSFGAYLVHVLILEFLVRKVGLTTISFNSALAVPSISIMVFVFALIISAIIHQIPILKKYIV